MTKLEYVACSFSSYSLYHMAPHSNPIWIHSSLCFWCGPVVPAALPAPLWCHYRSGLSLQRAVGFVQCFGWHCSETLCPGAARLSGTAGVSAYKNDKDNQVSILIVTIEENIYKEENIGTRKSAVTRNVVNITHALLILWWIDAMMISSCWLRRGAKTWSRVFHVPLKFTQIPAIQTQLCTHSVSKGGRGNTQLVLHPL